MDADAARRLLSSGCERFDVPGAQLGLLRGGERSAVCSGVLAAGSADPVRATTAFHAGSIAKSLAALVVVAAARRGDLDLDEPCSEQAPRLWPDTPRALMAQTTGRPNLLPDPGEAIEQFVARVGSLPPVHAPGRFSYGNPGWSVLDLLLRHRCGASFEELAADVLGAGATFAMPTAAAQGHQVATGAPPRAAESPQIGAAAAAGGTWWATADQLLDYAALHLAPDGERADEADVLALRRPAVAVPGATVADGWGLGWAVWDRGDHRAFGWAGFTGGHRAHLRCFPDQQAAVVLLTNAAGPLFGPPGGAALFDALLPDVLELLDVPPLPAAPPAGDDPRPSRPAAELAGSYGPARLDADAHDPDALVLQAQPFGRAEAVRYRRRHGDTFAVEGDPPGALVLAVDADLLYLGPFAFPRA